MKKQLISHYFILFLSLGTFSHLAEAAIIVQGDDQGTGSTLLSMTDGPLRADVSSLRILLDGSSVERAIFKAGQTQRYNQDTSFYREIRGFENPKLEAVFYLEDGRALTKTFPLIPGHGIDETPSIPRGLSTVSLHVIGERTLFKCFDANTCVFEKKFQDQLISRNDSSFQIQSYDRLLSCDNNSVLIERKITHPQLQRAVIKDWGITNYLEMNTNAPEGQATQSGTIGFATSVGTYGTGQSLRYAYLFLESGGLKVQVETMPYFLCNYTRLTSVQEEMSVATPLGASCDGQSEGNWWYESASPGADRPYSRNWFFRDCH